MIWVFGYGSLVWKAGFDYQNKIEGYIKGYRRVFYQASTEHRGTPSHPGRAATLIPGGPDDRVYGVVYGIEETSRSASVRTLDHREKQYDEKHYAEFFPLRPEEVQGLAIPKVMFYVGTPGCANWVGDAPAQDIARQIHSAQGPSGRNKDYVFTLADCMRKMGVREEEDVHLFRIEALVREIDDQDQAAEPSREEGCVHVVKQ